MLILTLFDEFVFIKLRVKILKNLIADVKNVIIPLISIINWCFIKICNFKN